MKISRYIKLRSLAHGPVDLALEQNHNPLRRKVPVTDPTREFSESCLEEYRTPLDVERGRTEPYVFCNAYWMTNNLLNTLSSLLRDKLGTGWIAWTSTTDCFLVPHATKSTFQPWDPGCDEIVSAVRSIVKEPPFWKDLSTHYSAENNSDVILQDNLCCVKSICEFSSPLILPLLTADLSSSPTP